MITVEQINAEPLTALTEEQQLALELLVRSYKPYREGVGRWPDVSAKIDAEQEVPTVKTKALRAVLTALSKLPRLVVESSGSEKSQSFFSTKLNWDELALAVLDTLYSVPVVVNSERSIYVFQRNITLNNRTLIASVSQPFFIGD